MNQNTYLSKFRNALKMNNLDAYIQPRSDMFGGEEVPDYDARLKFNDKIICKSHYNNYYRCNYP